MRRLSAAIRRPVTFALLQVDSAPDLWRELMDESLRAVSEGADLWPQVAGRATGLLSGHFTTYCLFDLIPAYQQLKAKGLSPEEFVAALRGPRCADPSRRGNPIRPTRRPHGAGLPHHLRPGQPARVRARAPSGRWPASPPRRGRTPLSVAYDAMLEDEGRGLLYVPILNYSDGDLGPGPGDAAASSGRGRPGRRRGPLRGHLRRRPAHVHAHPLDPGPDPGRPAPARVDGEEADPRHCPPLRAR